MVISIADRSPATLFLRYWHQAIAWTPTQRAASPSPEAMFHTVALQMLADTDCSQAHDKLESLVEAKVASAEQRRGRILGALRAIDEAFFAIHPRALITTTPSGGVVPPVIWLRDLRGERRSSGEYVRDTTHRLIARGPLLRTCRAPYASSGEALADEFSALDVVPIAFNHHDRQIHITSLVVPIDPASGVVAPMSVGEETVGFFPVATVAGQIEVTAVAHGDHVFADYRPAADFDAKTAVTTAFAGCGQTDIVIMPELTLEASHVDAISAFLKTMNTPVTRLVVAGSNLTPTLEDGLPHNECRIMNGRGIELWRQRKIWTASIDRSRAVELGLPDPGDKKMLENTACGSVLVVSDVDGLGRCIVLICQDLTMPVLAAEAITRFQPDWVFVPILDGSIEPGRWVHSHAFNLSDRSQARFLVVTNTSFAGPYSPGEEIGMGLAVGPKEPSDPRDEKRAVFFVPRPAPAAPQHEVLIWRSGRWHQTIVKIK